jgi:multicomponent Na+:H+ antiporter subunit E
MPRSALPAASSRAPPAHARDAVTWRVRRSWAWRVAVVLLLLWVLLAGVASWPVGAAVAVAGGIIGAWLAPGEPHPWRPWRLFGFAAYFVHASMLGGLDVARRALRRRVDVAPCFATYVLALPPGQPRTLMIGMTSLLPGTLSAALDAPSGRLLVHALDPDVLDSVPALERKVAWLFGLQVAPATPRLLRPRVP